FPRPPPFPPTCPEGKPENSTASRSGPTLREDQGPIAPPFPRRRTGPPEPDGPILPLHASGRLPENGTRRFGELPRPSFTSRDRPPRTLNRDTVSNRPANAFREGSHRETGPGSAISPRRSATGGAKSDHSASADPFQEEPAVGRWAPAAGPVPAAEAAGGSSRDGEPGSEPVPVFDPAGSGAEASASAPVPASGSAAAGAEAPGSAGALSSGSAQASAIPKLSRMCSASSCSPIRSSSPAIRSVNASALSSSLSSAIARTISSQRTRWSAVSAPPPSGAGAAEPSSPGEGSGRPPAPKRSGPGAAGAPPGSPASVPPGRGAVAASRIRSR